MIAELGASDGAIKVRGARERADAGQGRVELRLAPAVADVGAPIQARPGVEGSGRRRRRVSRSWPRVHVRSPRRSPREHNKSGRSKEKLFHRSTSASRCSHLPRQQLEARTLALG